MNLQSESESAVAILLRLHDALSVNGVGKGAWEPTPDVEANRLLNESPFAFLLAVIADYGMPAERAWQLPWRIKVDLGHLDPDRIARLSAPELEAVIRRVPQGHRFPGEVAKYFIAAGRRVVSDYRGDVARIWSGRDVPDALLHLDAFSGIGQKKSSMAVNILCRDLCWLKPVPSELTRIDVSYDIHVRRVFLRLGLVDEDTMMAVVGAARQLRPAYPGQLDLGAWHVGRTWCRPTDADCVECPLSAACPKHLSRNPAVS
jgi:endonuclease III